MLASRGGHKKVYLSFSNTKTVQHLCCIILKQYVLAIVSILIYQKYGIIDWFEEIPQNNPQRASVTGGHLCFSNHKYGYRKQTNISNLIPWFFLEYNMYSSNVSHASLSNSKLQPRFPDYWLDLSPRDKLIVRALYSALSWRIFMFWSLNCISH